MSAISLGKCLLIDWFHAEYLLETVWEESWSRRSSSPNFLFLRHFTNIMQTHMLAGEENALRSFTTRTQTLSRRHEQRRSLAASLILGISEKLEDELNALEDARFPGTCIWSIKKHSYISWQEARKESQPFFWLAGYASASKYVLSSRVLTSFNAINYNAVISSSRTELRSSLRLLYVYDLFRTVGYATQFLGPERLDIMAEALSWLHLPTYQSKCSSLGDRFRWWVSEESIISGGGTMVEDILYQSQ